MHDQTATVRFESLARLNRKDIVELRKMAGPVITHRAGTVLQRADEPVTDPLLLLDGWASSSIALQGGGRQIVKIHLPGDLTGLTSIAFTHCVDTVTALTDVQVCVVPQAEIGQMFQRNGRLAALLFLISLEERVMLADRLIMVGRAETGQRIAALLLQLRERVMRSEPSTGLTFRIPLTQLHLADMVGATTVHVSRVIQELSSAGLLKWERGKITIRDLEGLQARAGLSLRTLAQEPGWLPASSPRACRLQDAGDQHRHADQ